MLLIRIVILLSLNYTTSFFESNIKKELLEKKIIQPINFKEPTNVSSIDISCKAIKAKQFCIENELNQQICLLIDFSIHSGKNRLFIYDFNLDSIIGKALCTHGFCDNLALKDTTIKFSNVPESYCSSLGKYKIGKRGYSSFGIHINYRLHGLEKTNSNAFKRNIVLHSWDGLDDNEIYPLEAPNSLGCPSVSNNKMRILDTLLKKSKKPMLMWIYNK